MKYFGYKFLLSLLKIVMYLKRGIFGLGRKVLRVGGGIRGFFAQTIGFRFFKAQFFLKKRLDKAKSSWALQIGDFLGRRGTLQVILFFVFLIIMYPHSSLYSEDIFRVPGRQTVLYQLLGPGEQDFQETEEVVVDNVLLPVSNWRSGAIVYETGTANGQSTEPVSISGVGPGGTALVRPNIIPGATVGTTTAGTSNGTTGRREVTTYVVQNGDVIGQIASKFGVSVNTILWANNLSVRSYIRPGDTLKIPPGTGVLYVVKKGDTLSRISGQYNVTVDEIALANDIDKAKVSLSVGATLFLPGAQPLQVAPSRVLVRPPTVPNALDNIAAPIPSVTAPAGSGYIWPTSDRRINQYFGLRHTGVDIAGKTGNPNYAARAGKVIKSQCGWNGGYGCYIIVDHGGGVTTLYAHNSKLLVSVGEDVEQGQVIGILGSTGRSTGPHLHFEVRVGGAKVNPLKYVR